MACRTLLGKRAQRELLTAACARHALAVVERWHGHGTTVMAHLHEIAADGVSLTWDDPATAAELDGQPVEVHVAHEGRFYLFSAIARANTGPDSDGTAGKLIDVSPAARFDRTDRRRCARIDLLGRRPPIRAVFSRDDDLRVRLDGRLADVCEGGVSASVPAPPLAEVTPSDLYRLTIDARGQWPEGGVPVRLVYLRPGPDEGTLLTGWAFHTCLDRHAPPQILRQLLALVRNTTPVRSDPQGAGTRSTTDATGH